ncbi:MAG: amidohydrolase family protein, partial [Euryarchaeota archaeon]|nr:amidohydrolase family protein [Euryarchaeota archaeon]
MPVIDGLPVTDIHVHVQPWDDLLPAVRKTMATPREGGDLAFIERFQKDPGALVGAMDLWGVERMALVNYVAPDVMGFTDAVNDWVAAYTEEHRDRLIPVGSVHPRLHKTASSSYAAVERLVKDLGIPMLKLHPAHQLVWPDAYRSDSRGHRGHPPDDKAYSSSLMGLYEACAESGAPLMVHTGTSVFPGARNEPCDPMLLDGVASDHPNLTLILAHAGRPLWGEAACFVARRHPNVFLDLSGIPPHRLLHHVPALPRLWDKCLWGTDWPGPGLPAGAVRTNV